MACSAASSSSAGRASRRCRWPTARRSRTWRPSMALPVRSFRSTMRRSPTCAPAAAATHRSRASRPMRAPRVPGSTAQTPIHVSTTPCCSTFPRSRPSWPGHAIRTSASRWARSAPISCRLFPRSHHGRAMHPAPHCRRPGSRVPSRRPMAARPCAMARWCSPRSPAAPTPRTRPCWSVPGCSHAMRAGAACSASPG